MIKEIDIKEKDIIRQVKENKCMIVENGFKFYIDRDKFEVMLILGIPFTDMIGARIII